MKKERLGFSLIFGGLLACTLVVLAKQIASFGSFIVIAQFFGGVAVALLLAVIFYKNIE